MDELEQLHQQIAELQKKAQEVAQAKRLPIIEDMKKKISLYGITARELGFEGTVKPTVKSLEDKRSLPVAIKYRSGDLTWTGRGRKPKWLEEKLAIGSKLEEFLV
jgi:DNA-binding protein H-NS